MISKKSNFKPEGKFFLWVDDISREKKRLDAE